MLFDIYVYLSHFEIVSYASRVVNWIESQGVLIGNFNVFLSKTPSESFEFLKKYLFFGIYFDFNNFKILVK